MTKKVDSIDKFFLRMFKSGWFYIGLTGVAIAFLAWSATPSWEDRNRQRVSDTIHAINDDAEQKPVQAWGMWKDLEKELKGKKISSTVLKKKIEETQEKISTLYPEIQDEIERIENERKKAAAAKAEAAVELEKQRDEQEARAALRKKYRNINPQAKEAFASLKRLQAYTEVGVTKMKYQEALGEAWGNIKVFIESAEAKKDYPELSKLLADAIQSFKDAAEAWDADEKRMLQAHWMLASSKVREIDDLVNQ